MCVVIDLDAVCLVCLQPSKQMQSVFTTDVESSELQIAQKISILSELKIDQNNQTLPSKICIKCLQDLKAAWRFRKNCQAAVTIFQTIVSLDVEQPEEGRQNIAVKQSQQEKHVEQTTAGDEKPNSDIEINKKSSLEEYVIVSERDNSNFFEELGEHEFDCRQEGQDTNEFQSLEEVGETNEEDMEENEEEEDNLVEYYLNEESIAEELSIRFETQSSSNSANKQTKSKKIMEDKNSKQSQLSELLAKINKPVQRGRPRTKTKQTTEEQMVRPTELQNSKKVICKIKKEEVLSSENELKPSPQILPVRQVKSRKRKTLSPDTKPPKICEICGNSYRFQHALNAHMRRHYNEKPFPCELCDKAFVSNVELKRHLRVHTGQKPYACQYCDRRFSDFGSRIKHERTHTGEKPYVCGTCGKAFAYPHVLSVHLRTHTGEKKFRCDYCSKGFTKKVYLQSHLEQHHIGTNNYETINDEATSSSQEKCISGTDYDNEEAVEENTEFEEEEAEEPSNIVISSSRIQIKEDDDSNDGEEDNDEGVHEVVEILPDEYTIRVR